jgi:hypothetical protein
LGPLIRVYWFVAIEDGLFSLYLFGMEGESPPPPARFKIFAEGMLPKEGEVR